MRKVLSHTLVVLVALGVAVGARADQVAVVNAASFLTGSVGPGTIISVFGVNLTNTTAFAADADNLPRSLGGVTVMVAGVPSILFFVSPGQINAQIDIRVAAGAQMVVVTSPTGTFTTTVTIEASGRPGLFAFSGAGTREGAILNAKTFERGPFRVKTNGEATFLALFATGVSTSGQVMVTIGGVSVPVQFAGNAPGFAGLEQINIQLTPDLDGAGRVEVMVTVNGKASNVVEVVIEPSDDKRPPRREIAALASVPNTSLALMADEEADAVAVIDVSQRKVTRTIALPKGAQPAAIAVNAAGTAAVVAERNRGMVAILDLTSFTMTGEVAAGLGPSDVGIAGDMALVVDEDADMVTALTISGKAPVKTIAVGRGPRGIAVDVAGGKAVVTNEDAGTVSVVSLGPLAVTQTLSVGDGDDRPASVKLIPPLGVAVITEPSAGPEGKVVFLNLATGAAVSMEANPDRSGGLSDIAVMGTTVFFANQTGGSVTMIPVSLGAGGVISLSAATRIKADIGARALDIDAHDNLLLVTNEGSGTIVLIDLATDKVVGRINAAREED